MTREGPRSLVLRPEGGFLASIGDRMARSLDLPFRVGERIARPDYTVEVLETTPDGRPAVARFTFARALESPRYRWLCTRDGAVVPFALPAPGEAVTLAASMPSWR